jgi:hypothetical protein
MVEFALTLPMLLILLFGLADFGRVFQMGITLEAAARNSAEAAAQEYLQLARNRPGGTLDPADYDRLHTMALNSVCGEAQVLPFLALPPGVPNPTCSRDDGGTPVDVWPLAAACIHDGTDPGCGTESIGAPASCPQLTSLWDDTNFGATPSGAAPLPYVEVRVCYRFTTLFNLTDLVLPFGWSISLGEIFLERDREFTVANY